MYSFRVYKDTYTAVTEWLKILEEYDDSFIKESIAGFKSRRIQQQAISVPENKVNQEPVFSHIEIDENTHIKAIQAKKQNSGESKLSKDEADLHAIELQIFIEQQYIKTSFEDELENLSETISDFVDIDDNLIDYFK